MIRIIIFTIALSVIYSAKFVNASSLLIQIHNNLQSKLQYNLLTYRLNEKEHQLAKFYERKNFTPQWITVNGPIPAVSIMLETIKQADIEGLEPKDYMKKILKIEKFITIPLYTAITEFFGNLNFRACYGLY